jgi:hypothetical protein
LGLGFVLCGLILYCNFFMGVLLCKGLELFYMVLAIPI